MPMDAVVADFAAGAAELLSPAAPRRSLGRDRRPGLAVAPGLCRRLAGPPARQPARRDRGLPRTRPRRTCSAIPDYALPSIEETIDLALRLGRRTNPAIRCGGVSLNTGRLAADEAQRLLASESQRLGCAVADPMRGGAAFDALVDACLA